jgi:hypothetical protein
MVALIAISALSAFLMSISVPYVDAAAVTPLSHVPSMTRSVIQWNQTRHVTGTTSTHFSTETQSVIKPTGTQAVNGENSLCASVIPQSIIGTIATRTSTLPFSESNNYLVPYPWVNSIGANSNILKRQSTNHFYLKNSEVYYWSLNGM